MTDDSEPTTEPADIDDVETTDLSASSTYKVLGELDADSGAGILGRNTADSGTPIGVKGAVPNNSSGYGLSTPHDARIGGSLTDAGGNPHLTLNDGGPLGVGQDLDMGAEGSVALNTDDTGGFYDRPVQGHLFVGMAGDDAALLFGQAGSGGGNDGEFVVRTQDDGSEEIKLQQHDSANDAPPITQLRIDESGNTRINNDLLTPGGITIWDASKSYVPQSRLENDSVAVAGNAVSLGSATGIAHGDLSNIGASDHHTRPSAGQGLREDANAFDVEYTGAKAYRGTDQSLIGESADTDVVVAFDTERFDTGGNYDTSTFAFTAPTGGFYTVTTQVMLRVKSNADRVLKLQKDTGSGFVDVPGARVRTYESDDGATVTPSLTTDLQLNSGDRVRVVVRFLNALNTSSEFIRAESNLTIRRVGG